MEHIRFEGKGAKEAEEFVATVRGIALKEGKHKDPEWIAFFASSCFVGAALRWLEDLDNEVLCDWNSLRRAILHNWPTEHEPHITVVPAAAAAAAAPPIEQLTPEHPQPPSFLRCTGCGGHRLPINQNFCGQACNDETAEAASPSTIFENRNQEESGRQAKEGKKKGRKDTAVAKRGKQREVTRPMDLAQVRSRQQLEDETDAPDGQERTPLGALLEGNPVSTPRPQPSQRGTSMSPRIVSWNPFPNLRGQFDDFPDEPVNDTQTPDWIPARNRIPPRDTWAQITKKGKPGWWE